MNQILRPAFFSNVAELLTSLGNIPPERVRLDPMPGSATVAAVVANDRSGLRPCELIDGVLVEKMMGQYESRYAAVLVSLLDTYAREHRLGIVFTTDSLYQLFPDQVRSPDVSFIAAAKLPENKTPREAIYKIIPDLAIEIISEGNTNKEMSRKLREYFKAGVHQVWYVYPESQEFHVYTSVRKCVKYNSSDTLSCEPILPGLELDLNEYFKFVDFQF